MLTGPLIALLATCNPIGGKTAAASVFSVLALLYTQTLPVESILSYADKIFSVKDTLRDRQEQIFCIQ